MKKKDTRTKILEASLQLFSRKGYLGATTREIASKAGVAEVTLFRHFPSKEKLFEEMISRYSFLPALREMLPEIRNMEYREALIGIARRFLERLSERRELIRIMQSEMAIYPETVKKIYHSFIGEMFGMLASYFDELQTRGDLRKFHPERAAKAFLGMFYAHFTSRDFLLRKGQTSAADDDVIREFVDIFIRGTRV